jgi:hypothetical protein
MKAEELRIGNLVYEYKRSKISRKKIGVEICEIKSLNIHHLETFPESKSFEPIPLTDEWLIKFGFESDGIEWWDGIICLGMFKDGIYYLPTENLNDKVGQEFKYVHQLQNLYFALTGTDYPNVV